MLLFFYSLLLWSMPCSPSPELPAGEYLGYFQLSGTTEVIRVTHRHDSILVTLPDLAPAATLLAEKKANALFFQHRHVRWQLIIDQLQQDLITGTLAKGSDIGRLWLYPLAAKQALDTAPFEHNFVLPGGKVISIWAQRDHLRIHSPVSGRVSRLYNTDGRQFISDAGEVISFTELREEKYQQLQYQYLTGIAQPAIAVSPHTVQKREMVILGDTVGLSLYLPGGKGPFPACIIPMGAANYERWIYALEARLLAAHGIATLIYDNYGSGQSGGSLPDKTFADKRDQLVALHTWLARQPAIKPGGIGFRGGSQGGRLSLMAAAAVPGSAFVVALSAPMETRLDQQLYALSTHHRQQGFPEESIARNTEVWRRYFRAVADEKADPTLDAARSALQQAHPTMYLPPPIGDEVPTLPWAADLTDEGSSYLPAVNCPVLALYGTEDDRVPPFRSARILREGLSRAGKAPPSILFYPGASHALQLSGQRMVPGLFMDQINFIREVTD